MTPGSTEGERWRNWAGNQACVPDAVERPTTEAELVGAVRRAAARGRSIKVAGAGHSFTDIACTGGVQVRLDAYQRLLGVDHQAGWVKVQAGIPLGRLNRVLASRGLALENLGDIDCQQLGGAISTATHGTGGRFGGLATQVVGLELIIPDGSVITCSADQEPEVFEAGRVGLGALGAVSTITLRAVRDFNLHAVEEPMRLDHVLDHFAEYVADNEHFEFFWVPHTEWALTKRNNRTDEPPSPRRWAARWGQRVVMENVAFGALCRLGRAVPAAIPRLAGLLAVGGRSEYVDRGSQVFVTPRYVRFYEMEYAIPIWEVVGVLRRVQELIERLGLRISFPVEVRVGAADDIPLSTATGRPTGYIAVHVYQGMAYERYFDAVEEIFDSVGGRPHWGKLHSQTAGTLAPRYPQWDRWQAVRRRLDPEGRFANAYLERVVGPIA
jgi:L-gulono-1,4-lactone dehydrogenase